VKQEPKPSRVWLEIVGRADERERHRSRERTLAVLRDTNTDEPSLDAALHDPELYAEYVEPYGTLIDEDEPPENSFPPPIDKERGVKESFSSSETRPVPLGSLLENIPAEPAWVLRGYIAPYSLTLLAGRPKVGKSTAVFALLARVTVGEPFAGLETMPAGVLMLTEERRDTVAEKARILGLMNSFSPSPFPKAAETKKRPVHVLMRHDAGQLEWPELVRQAMAYCHQHELGVLVIDTWDRWTSMKGDLENAAGAVNEALLPLQFAASSGLAVVIVSHQRKSAGEYGEAVRGSTALTGGVDIVVELERPAPGLALGKHARVLRAVSRFNSTPEELYLQLDEEAASFTVIESPEEAKAGARSRRGSSGRWSMSVSRRPNWSPRKSI
jgi:hypothetical protein